MTASFLLFAILIGVVARMPEGELTATFVDGARDLLGRGADHRHRARASRWS